jgi:hypothetical protein
VKTKRTEITIEFEEIICGSTEPQRTPSPVCPACGAEVPMFTPEMAAVVSQVALSAANQQVESSEAHFGATEAGRLLLNGASLCKKEDLTNE